MINCIIEKIYTHFNKVIQGGIIFMKRCLVIALIVALLVPIVNLKAYAEDSEVIEMLEIPDFQEPEEFSDYENVTEDSNDVQELEIVTDVPPVPEVQEIPKRNSNEWPFGFKPDFEDTEPEPIPEPLPLPPEPEPIPEPLPLPPEPEPIPEPEPESIQTSIDVYEIEFEPLEHEHLKPVPEILTKPIILNSDSESENEINDLNFFYLCATETPNEIQNAISNKKANVNARGAFGKTALIHAVEKNPDIESVKVLLKAGADVTAKDKIGMNALMYAAAFRKEPEFIKILINAGIDVNARDSSKRTALIIAAHKNTAPVLKALLEAGAETDFADKIGWTALIYASYFGNEPEMISLLLDAGAEPKTRGHEGERAIDYARRNKHYQGTDVLKKLEEMSMLQY